MVRPGNTTKRHRPKKHLVSAPFWEENVEPESILNDAGHNLKKMQGK